jgi:hypothetical protein
MIIQGKFGAVLPFPDQVQACTHGPHPHFLVVALPVHDVGAVEAIRHQDLHGLGNQFIPAVSEQFLHLSVDAHNLALLVSD